MKKWIVDYISTNDDDIAHVWCHAESAEKAEDYVRGEYWDIKKIVQIRQA